MRGASYLAEISSCSSAPSVYTAAPVKQTAMPGSILTDLRVPMSAAASSRIRSSSLSALWLAQVVHTPRPSSCRRERRPPLIRAGSTRDYGSYHR